MHYCIMLLSFTLLYTDTCRGTQDHEYNPGWKRSFGWWRKLDLHMSIWRVSITDCHILFQWNCYLTWQWSDYHQQHSDYSLSSSLPLWYLPMHCQQWVWGWSASLATGDKRTKWVEILVTISGLQWNHDFFSFSESAVIKLYNAWCIWW